MRVCGGLQGERERLPTPECTHTKYESEYVCVKCMYMKAAFKAHTVRTCIEALAHVYIHTCTKISTGLQLIHIYAHYFDCIQIHA